MFSPRPHTVLNTAAVRPNAHRESLLAVPAAGMQPAGMTRLIFTAVVALCVCGGTTLAQDHEEAVVGYLGYLQCHETTSGSGDDNLNVIYGVLVGYTDGTYRTWGGYLLYRRDVGTRFKLGPQLERPLFVHSFLRTRRPTTIDTVIDQRRVQFVRVAVALHEYDAPWPLAQGRAGQQDITRQLNAVRWSRHAAELAGRGSETVFSQTLITAGQTTYADRIGRFEVKYSTSDLADPGDVYRAAAREHLTAFSSPPTRPRPVNTRQDFRMTGDGSDYRGCLWLTRGMRSIYAADIAGNSQSVQVPENRIAFLLQNQTPFDVRINIALEGGRSVQDRLAAGRRKQYAPGNEPGEVPTVTVSLPDSLVVGSADFARFRTALRRLRPLPVSDGRQYQLQFTDTGVAWVRLP